MIQGRVQGHVGLPWIDAARMWKKGSSLIGYLNSFYLGRSRVG